MAATAPQGLAAVFTAQIVLLSVVSPVFVFFLACDLQAVGEMLGAARGVQGRWGTVRESLSKHGMHAAVLLLTVFALLEDILQYFYSIPDALTDASLCTSLYRLSGFFFICEKFIVYLIICSKVMIVNSTMGLEATFATTVMMRFLLLVSLLTLPVYGVTIILASEGSLVFGYCIIGSDWEPVNFLIYCLALVVADGIIGLIGLYLFVSPLRIHQRKVNRNISPEAHSKLDSVIGKNIKLGVILISTTVVSVSVFAIMHGLARFQSGSAYNESSALILRSIPILFVSMDYAIVVTTLHLMVHSWKPRWLVAWQKRRKVNLQTRVTRSSRDQTPLASSGLAVST